MIAVAVDDEGREQITLAVDQPVGVGIARHLLSIRLRLAEALCPVGAVGRRPPAGAHQRSEICEAAL